MSEVKEITTWLDELRGRRRLIVTAHVPTDPDELRKLEAQTEDLVVTFTSKSDMRPLVVPDP